MINRKSFIMFLALIMPACGGDVELGGEPGEHMSELTPAQKAPRYAKIRDAARTRGIPKNAYMLAGIVNTETGLAHCWSEATWACKGPNSADCGNGPVIAGSADGACSIQQGGLGMFQFDAGTYTQTIAKYGSTVLLIDGQIGHAIAYVTDMVKRSVYTTNAETDAKALAWINNFDINNATLRDQWVKTTLRYYNGCQEGWSCWTPRIKTYTDGLWLAVNEAGGLGFWSSGSSGGSSGTRCGDSPATGGAIDAKYVELGGCASFLGAPTTDETATPNGVGRYNHFQNGGSIYWTPGTGAHEIHGGIHAAWAALGYERSLLGYPTTDESATRCGGGRYNDFEGGAITWSPAAGAHETHGAIRDRWQALEFECGYLGFPTSDVYSTKDGSRSDFEGGYILVDARGVATDHRP